MLEKSLTERVYDTLKGWGEPISAAEILSYLGMKDSRASRQRIAVVINYLRTKVKVPIKSTKIAGKHKSYALSGSAPATLKFKRVTVPNKMKEFVDDLRKKDVKKDRKKWGADAAIDISKGTGGDQTIARQHESLRQEEIDNVKTTAVPTPVKTKDLRQYEVPCHHYVLSKVGTMSSDQVADYYGLSEEEGACLLNRVGKRFPDIKLSVFAQVRL